jgi:hypothetical protein
MADYTNLAQEMIEKAADNVDACGSHARPFYADGEQLAEEEKSFVESAYICLTWFALCGDQYSVSSLVEKIYLVAKAYEREHGKGKVDNALKAGNEILEKLK